LSERITMKTVTKLYNKKGQIVRKIALNEPTIEQSATLARRMIIKEPGAHDKYATASLFLVPACIKLRASSLGGPINPRPQKHIKDIKLW